MEAFIEMHRRGVFASTSLHDSLVEVSELGLDSDKPGSRVSDGSKKACVILLPRRDGIPSLVSCSKLGTFTVLIYLIPMYLYKTNLQAKLTLRHSS